MSELRKAAKEALEVLEQINEISKPPMGIPLPGEIDFAMEALRQALAHEESEVARVRQVCRNVYEVWAGSEGIPKPQTAVEAYLLRLVEQMRDEAKEGLK